MELRLLWFVLAGFILGFATSMLWEWLYFRRQRMHTYSQPATTTGQASSSPYTLIDDRTQQPSTPGSTAEYRSPGVFLESEQPAPTVPLTHRPPVITTGSEPVPAEYELHAAQPNTTAGHRVSPSDETVALSTSRTGTEQGQNEQERS
jgi:hypothetical protein